MSSFLKDSKGFTLLEMLICLFLILVMVGLSTVLFASRQPTEQLKSAARDMVTTVRHAKMLAQLSGQVKVLIIDIDNNNFFIEGRTKRHLPEGTTVVVKDPINGIVNRGIYKIEFYPSGLSGIGFITITGQNRNIEIDLDPVMGASVVK